MSVSIIKKISAKQTYHLRHTVMWPEHPLEFIILPEDNNGEHFGLFVEDKLVSIVSLFTNDNETQFRKFTTELSEQGKGYGTKLLTFVIDHVRTNKATKIWCNARIDKTMFYEKFGMYKTDSTYTKGGIDFVILEILFD